MWEVLTATLTAVDATGHPVRVVCDSPTVSEVEDLFGQLGRMGGGDVWVEGQPGGRYLVVGGGPSRFLLYCQGDVYGPHNLADPEAKGHGDWITLTVGGLPSAVESATTVGAELAIRAIRYFHAHGEIDPALTWS
jgi:hypothetical protein